MMAAKAPAALDDVDHVATALSKATHVGLPEGFKPVRLPLDEEGYVHSFCLPHSTPAATTSGDGDATSAQASKTMVRCHARFPVWWKGMLEVWWHSLLTVLGVGVAARATCEPSLTPSAWL